MTPKLLTEEQLSYELVAIGNGHSTTKIRSHIAALTERNAEQAEKLNQVAEYITLAVPCTCDLDVNFICVRCYEIKECHAAAMRGEEKG